MLPPPIPLCVHHLRWLAFYRMFRLHSALPAMMAATQPDRQPPEKLRSFYSKSLTILCHSTISANSSPQYRLALANYLAHILGPSRSLYSSDRIAVALQLTLCAT